VTREALQMKKRVILSGAKKLTEKPCAKLSAAKKGGAT